MATAAYRPFVCSICLNDYKDPKFLTCFHSFCFQCLKDCFEGKKGQSIKCPLCRKLTPMPEDGIKGLSNNIYLETGKDTGRKGKLYCGFCCSNNVAEFHCLDCADYLCIKCKDQHVQMKQTKAHMLEILEEEEIPNEQGIEMCRKHTNKELLFGCYHCNEVCCSECWETCHKEHKIGPLTEVSQAVRQSVRKAIDETKTQLVDIVKEEAGLLVDRDKINNLIGHTDTEIDKIGDELKRRIDKIKISMKKELRDTSDALNKEIQTLLDSNEAKNKLVTDLTESTMNILDKSSNIHVLTVGTDLKNMLVEKNSETPDEELLAPQIITPDIERTMLTSLRDQSDATANNIFHPTINIAILHYIPVKTKNITTITCLANGCLLVCDNKKKRLHQLSVEGDRLGSFKVPCRIEDVVQLSDGSLITTKYRGQRLTKFWLEGNYVDNSKTQAYTLGISLTRDGNSMILCCSDISEEGKCKLTNSRLLIMSPVLEVQQELRIPSGREVVRRACQNRNGNFVAITSRRCFILSRTGELKYIYKFKGRVHSVCTDKYGNIIMLHEDCGTKRISLYNASMIWIKELCTLVYASAEETTCSLTMGGNGCLWVTSRNRIGCIKYTL